MALQSSGAISLADLAGEFPDSTPYSLSEFYRGGGKVPDAAGNSAVPTSGAISLGNFYGAVNRVAINITLSANQTNYVLNTAKASGYVAGISDITLTIDSGIYVSSNTTGGYALNVDTSWNSGDTITIVNNGFIVGMGGAGGRGSAAFAGSGDGTGGASGGPAFIAQRAVTVNNAGTIGGGGGGGGGGGSRVYTDYGQSFAAGGGGGGGRSGTTNSAGGAGGVAQTGGPSVWNGANGGSGTASAAGGGGAGGYNSTGNITGGAGGGGGGWGASGASGLAGTGGLQNYGAKSGGGAGAAVAGNSNITWTATGTRLGAIT